MTLNEDLTRSQNNSISSAQKDLSKNASKSAIDKTRNTNVMNTVSYLRPVKEDEKKNI
jgi:hypothetical protein